MGEARRANKRPANAFDLVIVGAGLAIESHLTREAVDAIAGAPALLYSRYHRDAVRVLRRLNPRAVLLEQEAGEYVVGLHRPAMYDRIAEAIVRTAEDRPGTVSLHPGSALVVDTITQLALEKARARGMRVTVLPGVSSIDAVMTLLELEVAEGLQVVLAQYLFLNDVRLSPNLDAIVLQPAYYDTRWYLGSPVSTPGRYEGLRDHLGHVRTDDRGRPVQASGDRDVRLSSTLRRRSRERSRWWTATRRTRGQAIREPLA